MTHPDAQRAFEEMMPEPADYEILESNGVSVLYPACDYAKKNGIPRYTADQLRTAMQAVWDAATERAATVCEEHANDLTSIGFRGRETAEECAAAIRGTK